MDQQAGRAHLLRADERERQPTPHSKVPATEPIALIGIGCRFPGGANDPDAFWRILSDGVDAITEVPPDRWNAERFYDPRTGVPGKTNACRGGFVEGLDQFDANFFGISPREATRMDPQQRMLVEVAWEAIEDGGLVWEQLSGRNVGVFVGVSSQDYTLIQHASDDLTRIDAHSSTGGAMSIVANRLSYCLNLRGPSIALDTACSSSLVAVHLACQSLWNHDCSMALAGGVNALIKPEPYVGFSRLSMLSPDGQCKAFDAAANGFVRSEGAGVIVLKRLSEAVRDGDRVVAVIRGSAVNQDGRTSGLTVPSSTAQAALIEEACQHASVDPRDVQFAEAHGTGTLVGDPIEATALGSVLGRGRSGDDFCRLGSVKTNIGHLEPAAGIAGLIKVALALQHGQIPPNLHFNKPNPEIPFEELKLRVQQSLEPWSKTDSPPIAVVNSFGFGGTNAHVILQGTDENQEPTARLKGKHEAPAATGDLRIIPFSARSQAALQQLATETSEMLSSRENGHAADFDDLHWTLAYRRSHHDHRMAVLAKSADDLVEKLCETGEEPTTAGVVTGHSSGRQGVAFVFCGQGAQWWKMGRELLDSEPLFRQVIEQCDELFGQLGPWSLLEELRRDESTTRLNETAIAQPALYAIQVALAKLWLSWGIEPSAVVGHSVGEVAAAHVSGALSFEEGARVIFHRGRCMDFAAAHGRMLAVGLPAAELQELVDAHSDRISIAAINSPSLVSLSGDGEQLQEIAATLEERGVFNRFLQVNYAFHSPMMDPIRPDLLAALEGLEPGECSLPMYSTVTGELIPGTELGPSYWWKNVRQAVRFADAVDQMVVDDMGIFVELGPHPVLSSSISEIAHARNSKPVVLHSLRREDDERQCMLTALAGLYTHGCDVDWTALSPATGRLVKLPKYPWQHERFWHEAPDSNEFRVGPRTHDLLGKRVPAARPIWESRIDGRVLSYLADHRVQESALLPATSFLEMAMAAVKEQHGRGAYVLENVELSKACFLPEETAVNVQLVTGTADSSFEILSRSRSEEQQWTSHVKGTARLYERSDPAETFDVAEVRARCPHRLSQAECYQQMHDVGLDYGPAFQGLTAIWQGEAEALGHVEVPDDLLGTLPHYEFHPALLDACFQVIIGTLPSHEDGASVYVPVEFEKVRVYGSPDGALWSHARLVKHSGNRLTAEVRVFDEEGRLLAEVEGFHCQALEGSTSRTEEIDELVYEYRWELQPRADQSIPGLAAQHLLTPNEICETTIGQVDAIAHDLGLDNRTRELGEQINQLATQFLLTAFRELGWELKSGARVTAEKLSQSLAIDPRYHRLVERYLELLSEDNIVVREGDEWVVADVPPISDPEPTWRKLLTTIPAFHAELTLLGRCGRQLSAILKGDVDPLQLIFPEGSMAVAEHLYQDSPSFRFFNTLAQRSVSKALEALPRGRTVRILEIGAGTGGMTSYVLPILPADRTQYVYTDLSSSFFLKAGEKFGEYDFLEFKRLDIEEDPLAQEFEPHAFDVILASECLHATTDLRQTMQHVKSLMAPDGMLLLLEAVKPLRWVDLVFGLTEGWWRFTDTDLRPNYPLLPFAQWRALLQSLDFVEVCEAAGQEDDTIENAVLIARGPHFERDAAPAVIAQRAADEADTEPLDVDRPRRWLILADRLGTADRVANVLTAAGETCVLVRQGEEFRRLDEQNYELTGNDGDELQRLVQTVFADDAPPIDGLLHFWNVDAPTLSDAAASDLEETLRTGCLSALYLAQAFLDVDAAKAPRAWLITQQAQSVGDCIEATESAQACAWGLGRVMVNEIPKLRTTIVDLSGAPSDDEIRSFCQELWLDEPEDEIALRGEARYVHRYTRSTSGTHLVNARSGDSGGQSYRLETTRAGVFDNLTLRAIERAPLEPGRVEVRIEAAGTNFADVLKALGLYPGLGDGPVPLGIECSGKITAVGPGVEQWRPGDEVVAVAPFAFGTHVTTEECFIARKPQGISFQEAATLPIAYLTSHYALNYLGRLAKGERVLIHSATGGVGLAAIQLAQRVGAEVFATAGTPEKRDFLRSIGIEHVFDSRSLAFAEEVMQATGGEGVDVVLNSLAGEAIEKGLEVLTDYGRFLEIGKRDIYGNTHVGLRPFKNNLSFMAIDLDRLMRQRPQLLSSLFQELVEAFDKGELSPLPYRVFPASNAAAAFRYMAQAKHIGKVVLSLREEHVKVSPPLQEDIEFRSDATYLLTGGLGGFGVTVARWMIERGARHLVLIGRSGASSPTAAEAVQSMRATGAQVEVVRADVTDEAQVQQVLSRIDESMPPLKGVLHAAMVLKDCLIQNLTDERVYEVWAPKVIGAWNLHKLTQDRDLDCFVLFSSLASVFGNGGQANYASANAFLDSLVYYRKAHGLPAVAISWGFLGQVGWVANHEEIAERLESQGVASFTPKQALSLLGRFIRDEPAHVGVMRMDWRLWGQSQASVSRRFGQLVREETEGAEESLSGGSSVRQQLIAAGAAERVELMQTHLAAQVARVLGADLEKLDVDRPLTELGLDSLMAVELRNWIEGDLRLSLPTVELMRGPTVAQLAEILVEQLGKPHAVQTESSTTDQVRDTEPNSKSDKIDVAELSDDEVDALLQEMTADDEGASG